MYYLLLLLFCFSCTRGKLQMSSEYKASQRDVCDIVNEIRDPIIQKYKAKYGVSTIAIPMDGNHSQVVHKVGVVFVFFRVIAKEEARKIVVECTQDFLFAINRCEELRPFFINILLLPKMLK